MTDFILQLSDPQAALENVGGKGMSLARLSRAGLPVPGGFHLTTDCYWRFVTANELQPRILEALKPADPAELSTLNTASQCIAELFAAAAIPAEVAGAIADAYAVLKDIPVAVRSSATAEDLPGASFAGQQDTYLNIRGKDAVLEAIKRCWASLWTARAIGYRLKNGIDQESVALAVVVQELVPADASGVLFTANPVSGRREDAMITAAWGLGEAIVSGIVTPDTLTVEKTTGRINRQQISEKQTMTVRTDAGTCEQAVPDALKKKAVLSPKQAAELVSLGVTIEKLYGIPMDIEWALARGRFAILQARPITSLPEPALEWISPYPKAILMRQSFAEFVPNPVSPLFATLAVPIASQASQKMFHEFLPWMDPNSTTFSVVNHYVYLGFELNPNSLWAIIRGVLSGQIQKMLKTSQVRWTAVRAKYHDTVTRWQAVDQALLPPTDLLRAATEIFEGTAQYYTVAQSGPIPSASSSELSFTRFYLGLVKRKTDPAAPTFLLGLDTLALRSERALFALAQSIKGQPELAQAILKMPVDEICAALQYVALHHEALLECQSPTWAEFSKRFASYLAEFGHMVYDLDFAKPIPADDPAPLVGTIKAYLDGKGSDPVARQRATDEKREQATRQVSARLDPLRRKWFQKLLRWAQENGPKREDCISDLGWGYPLLRSLFKELGRRLAAGGAILSPADIYWLESQEVETLAAALERGEALLSYNEQVEQRKAGWQRARTVRVPLALPEKSWVSGLLPRENKAGSTLKGVGASSGRVTAPACVLRDPQDFDQLHPGDVIVAVTTTPAWTPLFAIASAVVTEIGGPLSHSSIVAREFGIPAVLAAGNATHRIHTGEMITVDGDLGTVLITV
jgi:pyruvate,water dikinase